MRHDPWDLVSEARRAYWLWTRSERPPQDGHAPDDADARTVTTARSPSISDRTTAKQGGTRLDGRTPCCIALIPSGNQRQITAYLQRD